MKRTIVFLAGAGAVIALGMHLSRPNDSAISPIADPMVQAKRALNPIDNQPEHA